MQRRAFLKNAGMLSASAGLTGLNGLIGSPAPAASPLTRFKLGVISDEFSNPTKRRAMMEKRMRKQAGIDAAVPPPQLAGSPDAAVTLIGWGSTQGVIAEACELLNEQGISANQLQIRWLVPLHGAAIVNTLKNARHTIIVENNYSGQFARYLRSETSFVPNGHIRKYDGEPFMPHHIVEAVKEQLKGTTTLSVPVHEITV